MSYNLEIENNGHYLFISIAGTRDRETIVDLIKGVIEASKKHSVDKVLVDVRDLEGRLSIIDSYSIATKVLPKWNRLGVVKKIILVDSKANIERIQFFGRIAQSLGMNIQVFFDIDEAKEMISQEEVIK